MIARPRKPSLALIAALALSTLGLSACGGAQTHVTTGTYAGEAGKNAPYLNVGPLIYQVQLARQLNPFNNEDAAYLQGIEGPASKLQPGQVWFLVSLQVYNRNGRELEATNSITLRDTQGNVYAPIAPNSTNVFAYRGGGVPPNSQLPVPGTVAAGFGSQGQVLLFKIFNATFDNRPIEIKIVPRHPGSPSASAELDV